MSDGTPHICYPAAPELICHGIPKLARVNLVQNHVSYSAKLVSDRLSVAKNVETEIMGHIVFLFVLLDPLMGNSPNH